MSTFDFSTLDTKLPFVKLRYISNETTDFDFKVQLIIVQEYVGHGQKVKLEDLTLCKNKTLFGVFLNNSFLQLGSKIFRQFRGIPMGSDPTPFLADLF